MRCCVAPTNPVLCPTNPGIFLVPVSLQELTTSPAGSSWPVGCLGVGTPSGSLPVGAHQPPCPHGPAWLRLLRPYWRGLRVLPVTAGLREGVGALLRPPAPPDQSPCPPWFSVDGWGEPHTRARDLRSETLGMGRGLVGTCAPRGWVSNFRGARLTKWAPRDEKAWPPLGRTHRGHSLREPGWTSPCE